MTEPRSMRAARVALIRRSVMYRAGGRCENPECECIRELEMDHWHGGPERRLLESVETCWALCTPCHRARQANEPSAAAWNQRFRQHCERYGYGFAPHAEHKPLPPGGRVA